MINRVILIIKINNYNNNDNNNTDDDDGIISFRFINWWEKCGYPDRVFASEKLRFLHQTSWESELNIAIEKHRFRALGFSILKNSARILLEM